MSIWIKFLCTYCIVLIFMTLFSPFVGEKAEKIMMGIVYVSITAMLLGCVIQGMICLWTL